jgi:hypothetical protein
MKTTKFSKSVLDKTETSFPTPWGRTKLNRIFSSACLGSTPKLNATSTDSAKVGLLNAHTVDHAAEMIAGTAVSMGIEVDRWKLQNFQNWF